MPVNLFPFSELGKIISLLGSDFKISFWTAKTVKATLSVINCTLFSCGPQKSAKHIHRFQKLITSGLKNSQTHCTQTLKFQLMDCTSVNYYVFWWKKNALYKHQKLKDYCVKPLGSSFRTYCSWWLAEPCLVHGRVSLALGPCTVRAATHVIFIMFICGLPVQADLCWLVPPDSISSPHFWRHVCKHRVGLWSERVDALQTGSHTRCLCTKRKKHAEKKHFFFSASR